MLTDDSLFEEDNLVFIDKPSLQVFRCFSLKLVLFQLLKATYHGPAHFNDEVAVAL